MTTRITTKLRREAAMLCSAAASFEVLRDDGQSFRWHMFYGVLWLAEEMGLDSDAALLAERTRFQVSEDDPKVWPITRETWAEAEARLMNEEVE